MPVRRIDDEEWYGFPRPVAQDRPESAGKKRVLDHETRRLNDAQPCFRRRDIRYRLVDGDGTAPVYLDLFAVPVENERLLASGRRKEETYDMMVLFQIQRMFWFAISGEVGRGSTDHDTDL